jgi:hypothetical protein
VDARLLQEDNMLSHQLERVKVKHAKDAPIKNGQKVHVITYREKTRFVEFKHSLVDPCVVHNVGFVSHESAAEERKELLVRLANQNATTLSSSNVDKLITSEDYSNFVVCECVVSDS